MNPLSNFLIGLNCEISQGILGGEKATEWLLLHALPQQRACLGTGEPGAGGTQWPGVARPGAAPSPPVALPWIPDEDTSAETQKHFLKLGGRWEKHAAGGCACSRGGHQGAAVSPVRPGSLPPPCELPGWLGLGHVGHPPPLRAGAGGPLTVCSLMGKVPRP